MRARDVAVSRASLLSASRGDCASGYRLGSPLVAPPSLRMHSERFFLAAEEQLGQVQPPPIGLCLDRSTQLGGGLVVPAQLAERVPESNPAVAVVWRLLQGLAKESLRSLKFLATRIDLDADINRSQLLNRCLDRR